MISSSKIIKHKTNNISTSYLNRTDDFIEFNEPTHEDFSEVMKLFKNNKTHITQEPLHNNK